jgi:hypothetical protein
VCGANTARIPKSFSEQVIGFFDLPHRSPTELVGLGRHFGGATVNANRRKDNVIAKRDTSQPNQCGDSNGSERIHLSYPAHIVLFSFEASTLNPDSLMGRS